MNVTAKTVLVVEDEPDVRSLVRELLQRAGYDVVEADSGKAALRALYARAPDLVVLDIVLPELDGWETLERIRELTDVPVLMLTALSTEIEKVRGLRAGADDYVTKPFGRQELLARVEALLRRAGEDDNDPAGRSSDGLVTVDYAQRAVEVAGRQVALTPLEYRLLVAFVEHPDQVLSHDRLLELAWGSTRGGSRDQVRLYVNYVRRRLGKPASEAIETVRGFGYRYRPGAASTRR